MLNWIRNLVGVDSINEDFPYWVIDLELNPTLARWLSPIL